jgi:hypothetical protein
MNPSMNAAMRRSGRTTRANERTTFRARPSGPAASPRGQLDGKPGEVAGAVPASVDSTDGADRLFRAFHAAAAFRLIPADRYRPRLVA